MVQIKTKKYTTHDWWICDEGFVAAGSGEDYVTLADPRCSDLDPQELDANTELMAHAPQLAESLLDVLNLLEAKLDKEELVGHPAYLKAFGLVQALEQHGCWALDERSFPVS